MMMEMSTQRVRVWWSGNRTWFHGVVVDFDEASWLHYVKYDDGELKWHSMWEEVFEWLSAADKERYSKAGTPRAAKASIAPAPSAPAAAAKSSVRPKHAAAAPRARTAPGPRVGTGQAAGLELGTGMVAMVVG